MTKRIAVAGAVGLGLVFGWPAAGFAQQKSLKDQIVGTWTFVSAMETRSDGSKNDRWGANPKGVLMFDANGRFVQIIHRSDLPKFAGAGQNAGTADEFKAVMQNTIVTFGTYSIDESAKILITNVEGGIYPNAHGATQKRTIEVLNGEDLKYINPATNVGQPPTPSGSERSKA